MFEHRQVRVGILPEGEEILIRVPGLARVAGDNVCSAELQVRQGADRIGGDDTTVIEDFLKFRRGLPAASCRKICLTA